MIKPISAFTLYCDDCETPYPDSDDYIMYFTSEEDARVQARNSEWWSNGNTDVCERCRYINEHNFITMYIFDAINEDCDRCGNPREEHDSPKPQMKNRDNDAETKIR